MNNQFYTYWVFFPEKKIDTTIAIFGYIFQSIENETFLPVWQLRYMCCYHYEIFTKSGAVRLSTLCTSVDS